MDSGSNGKGLKRNCNDNESEFNSSPRMQDTTHTTSDSKQQDGKSEGEGSVGCGIHNYSLLKDPEIKEMKFVSEEEVHNFYNAYAKAKGFSIRKSRSKPLKGNDLKVRYRSWVCSKEGKRDNKHFKSDNQTRRHRPESRSGCGAKFRVRYVNAIEKYIVKCFKSEQNHTLAPPHCVPFLRSHRCVKGADKAQATAMQKVGMKCGQLMDYMVCQSGGFHNVGYIDKDLRNKLDRGRKDEIRDGNAEGALGYLSAKVKNDLNLFFKYTVDDENRLEALFWANGRCRMDYVAFGDVLMFDTTYRTNAYKKPLVILAGVSNHFRTVIFGCALLANESEETYKWVLNVFLEAMDGKRPISIVTDGDLAMRNAIRTILPNARHQLCTWHLERNACTNVHKSNFASDFTTMMLMECEEQEFEDLWVDMVAHYGLQTNSWVKEIYKERERWAEAYLLGHFFAGMRSTQRCEGMNGYLNRFLKVRLRLYEFVEQFDHALDRIRVADAKAETETEQSAPVLITHMKSLEKHGSEVYTQYMFKLFQEEIIREGSLVVANRIDEGDRCLYYMEYYSHSELTWTVEYHPNDNNIKCCCLMYESFGLPCCHMIAVMKYEHLVAIPECLIMQRWTRRARSEGQSPTVAQISRSLTHTARYGILSSHYNLMSFYASHEEESFQHARQVGEQMTSWMRKRWEMRRSGSKNEVGETSGVGSKFGVADPVVVKPKGRLAHNSTVLKPWAPRKCNHCKGFGHDKRTCSKLSSNK